MHLALPDDLAVLPVHRVDHPAVLIGRNPLAVAAKVKAFLRRFRRARTDDGGHKDPVTPYDRRGPAAPRDFRFPDDIPRRAPSVGQVGIVGYAARLWPPELRPAIRGSREGSEDEQDQESTHETTLLPRKNSRTCRLGAPLNAAAPVSRSTECSRTCVRTIRK